MQNEPAGVYLTWHTIEKGVWTVVVVAGGTLLTVARPWLGRQLLRLLREDEAGFKKLGDDVWAESFFKLQQAASQAGDALRKVDDMRERMERVESAVTEQGDGLAAVAGLPAAMVKMASSLELFMKDFSATQILLARVEERQKKGAQSG
jgi:hypothetical protein